MNKRAGVLTLSVALLGLGSWMAGISRAATVELSGTPAPYSAAALYNLGNAYARSHNPALAVLNYERALVLAPMDPDIQANMRKVRASAGLPAPTEGWLAAHDLFAPNTMYWLGLFGLVLAGASFLVRRFHGHHRGAFTVAAAVGVLLTTLSVCDALATASLLHESVVMQRAPASASPIFGAAPLFTAPAAEVVSVLGVHQGFLLIRDSRGREGWVARNDLTPIIPSRAASSVHAAPT